MSKRKFQSPQKVWENVSSVFVHFVESIFFWLGVLVARHPWKTVILTWVFVLMSGAGLLKFFLEKNPMNLWVPPDSDFLQDTNWYIDKFGTGFRIQKIIFTADNVLDKNVLLTLHDITEQVNSIRVDYKYVNYTMNDLCFKVPDVKMMDMSNSDYSDPTLWVGDEFYCGFLERFNLVCLQNNMLDLWKNDISLIRNTTPHEIVSKINNVKVNPVSGHPMNYSQFLGGIKRDESGDIVTASSVMLSWYTQVDMGAVDLNEVGNLVGTEDWVSIPLAMWEKKFLDLMNNFSHSLSHGKLYYEAGRSFGDVSGESMFNDMDKLFMGIILMFFYIIVSLSNGNWLEIKLTLGSVGLLCVGMAYVTSVSWCSIMGIPFGPVHSSLPFLLMGLGVDDMFVMSACWNNLSSSECKKSLPVKVGLMLKHAGVSIVITSFTDIVALLIGAITILPSLKSFCIYAAVGVFFIFCFSVTFYVAVFTLDLKRMEANRNGILFCYQHRGVITVHEGKSYFQKLLKKFFENIVFTLPGRAIVIIFTLAMTGFSVDAILRMEQRFDPRWFIPEDSYYKDYITSYDYYYPDEGYQAMVFLGEMDYKDEFPKLYNMVQELKNESYVTDVAAWVESFDGYVSKNYQRDLKNTSSITDDDFRRYLSRFLFSSIGGRFQMSFKFSESLECGKPSSNITSSYLSFKFTRFHGPKEYIPAMNHVKYIVKHTNITSGDGYRSVYSKAFANWVTDEIIAVEVERNIELALLCVMFCTVILITNLQMCLWILICVLLTIVNVLGWMQRWGMTVDIVCCIGLELAIGLCVDYAAHVSHTFLTISEGSRYDRALNTVVSIGTAVLLGGGSTFLSLSLLSTSKAYTFQSFFKIFFLVIIFGLFNGLIFLPVMLSLVGPGPYRTKKSKDSRTVEAIQLNGKEGIDKQIDDG